MIYGARLRQAREMALMTQAELSRETQIAQAHLSRAERDLYDVGLDRLALLAAHLEFPTSFFTTAPTVDFGQRPVHFRSQAGMSMKQADQATRTGEVVVEAVLRLETQFEGPALHLPPAQEDAAAAAVAMRSALGIAPDEPIHGLPILLERAGVTVIGLPLGARRRDAFSLWTDGKPVIALLETDAGDRQLWSTAHEVGHLLLHRGIPAHREIESAADEFAMHFLTPPHVLERELPAHPTMSDFAMLKRRWGVSIAALIRLARRLDRLTAEQYTSLFKQMSARGERLRERTFIPPVKPRGLRAMAELAYGAAPAPALAADNNWSPVFAERVLDRHARADELPHRKLPTPPRRSNIVNIASARGARARGRLFERP
jgi:Zn-dependent peptidase ImmA (M78 family)/transcriptional regulator with XRE-family HTH domain